VKKALRVLFVEDRIDDVHLILREFEHVYEVAFERVETADAMQAALERQPWDLIVSDYSMPTFSAPAAVAVRKALGVDVPCIIVSGTVGEETAVESLQAGADDFIVKGRFARLLPAVERALRQAEERRARWLAEEARRQGEAQYRRIVETTQEGLCVINADDRITFMNRRMAAMLGIDGEAWQGASIDEFVVDDDGGSIERAHLEGLFTATGRLEEVRFKRRDGSYFLGSLSNTPTADVGRDDTEVLVMVSDITERKQLEEQFRQAQKMEAIGQLAGGVAHDFNNLLTVILGFTAFLDDAFEKGDPRRKDLLEIQKAGERAASLTRQLLAFSRKQILQPSLLDLNVVVTNTSGMLRRLLGEDIEFVTVLESHLAPIVADAGQLEQVLMNLAVNARDAMANGGKLTIETANVELDAEYLRTHPMMAPGPYVMLAVSDTGTGMDEATKRRIFEPFFTTKEPGKGTGLGLATIYGIVKQSGGDVLAYSEVGLGTTIKVYLPPAEPGIDRLEPEHAAESADATLGSETVLLVEDEESVRLLAGTTLERTGYHVLTAANPKDALALVERHAGSVDLLLTDVVMPGASGPDLFNSLSMRRPDMKVLYMSGYTDQGIVPLGVLDPGVPFLQKPFTPTALVRKVRRVLDA